MTGPLTLEGIPPEYEQDPPQPYANLPSLNTWPEEERI
jgi:hypothetical protein